MLVMKPKCEGRAAHVAAGLFKMSGANAKALCVSIKAVAGNEKLAWPKPGDFQSAPV